MGSQSVKKAIRYLIPFFRDIAQLYAQLERELAATEDLVPHPQSGNKTSWTLSSHLQYPECWILQDLHRVYVSREKGADGSERYAGCLVFMLTLYPEGLIPEPALLCAWLQFPQPLTAGEVYKEAWKSKYFRSFDRTDNCWHASAEPSRGGRLVALVSRYKEYREGYVESARLFAVDVMTISSSAEVGNLLVRPIVALMRGEEPNIDHALVFPDELVQAWMRPI